MVSPMASWKPSLALSRNRNGWLAVGALIEIVAQFVVDGEEILAGDLDADFDAQIVGGIDIPGAGVAYHVAVARLREQRALPESLRQRRESERGEEALAVLHHLSQSAVLRALRMAVTS